MPKYMNEIEISGEFRHPKAFIMSNGKTGGIFTLVQIRPRRGMRGFRPRFDYYPIFLPETMVTIPAVAELLAEPKPDTEAFLVHVKGRLSCYRREGETNYRYCVLCHQITFQDSGDTYGSFYKSRRKANAPIVDLDAVVEVSLDDISG